LNRETLAIHGGTPTRATPSQHSPQTTIVVSDAARKRVSDLLDGGILSEFYGGPYCREFEAAFQERYGGGFAVACNSGTSALHLAVRGAGIQPGDEVIMPAQCFISAAMVVVQEGGIPVACDAEPQYLTQSIEHLEALITLRTRAIMPVHMWGAPTDMDAVRRVASRHGLSIIEDCCQSHGSTVGDTLTGRFGDYGCFSFASRKHVSAGEGGLVLSRTAEQEARIRSLVNLGKGAAWLDYRSLGYSYRMVEFSAIIAKDGLDRLDEEVALRRRTARILREALASTPLIVATDPPWGRHVFFKVPVQLPEEYRGARQFIVSALMAENVGCRPTHPPLYNVGWLRDYLVANGRSIDPGDVPVTSAHQVRIFEVESGPNLSEHDAQLSAEAVRKVWRYVEEHLEEFPRDAEWVGTELPEFNRSR
jgi:perosamine synthetase